MTWRRVSFVTGSALLALVLAACTSQATKPPSCESPACTDGEAGHTRDETQITSVKVGKTALPDSPRWNPELEIARKKRQAWLHGGSYDVNGDGVDDIEITVKDGRRRMHSKDSSGETILILEGSEDGTVQQWDLRLTGDQLVLWRKGGHSIHREDADRDGIIDSETETIIDRSNNTTTIVVREMEKIGREEHWREVFKRTRSGTSSH